MLPTLQDLAAELTAIAKSQAVIEFTLDGFIIDANDRFLETMGYALAEIEGKHHSLFVDPRDRHGTDYIEFWAGLKRGDYQAGAFKRVGKNGREVWLQAAYNPILDVTGAPFKIVKIATDITRQKREAAERLWQIEAISKAQAMAEFALDGTILAANGRFLAATGYDLAEIEGRNHSLFVDPATRDSAAYRRFWADLTTGQYHAAEYRRIGKGGREVWWQASYNPILDGYGKPIKILKVATDITAQRLQAADRIQQLEAIGHTQAMIEFAMDGTIISANERFLATMGYTAAEVTGQHHAMFIDPDERNGAAYREFWANLRSGQRESGEFKRIGKGGREVWLQATYNLIRDMQGRPVKIVKTAIDVTEQKLKTADHVSQIQAIHRSQAVVEFALDGTILSANQRFLTTTGYAAPDIIGRHHSMFVSPGDRGSHAYQQLWADLNAGEYRAGEFRRIGKGGKVLWMQASYNPILDVNGRVCKIVKFATDVTEHKRKVAAAEHDFLTGLPNRMLMNDRITQAIALARRHAGRLALLFLDLDGFKPVNDSLGHPVGDKLLQSVARRLHKCVRGADTVSRQGGDEFMVLLSELRNPEDAAQAAKKLLHDVSKPHQIDGTDLHVTASIGISVYPDDGQDAETLIKNADTAMYQAKEKGRQGYQFFKPAMNARAAERQSLEESLRHALERKEFSLHYQPLINVSTGEIAGAEALLRWTHPTRGAIPPARFIPVAEDCGLILPIGAWVLREACHQAQAWIDDGAPPIGMSVNVSALQFRNQKFPASLLAILRETKLDPSCLELELTETLLMQRADLAVPVLHSLRDIGVHVALDDFGTGYSSLSYLTKLPIDTLKVDQSFIRELGFPGHTAGVVTAIMAMAHSLKLRVVAEGVETPEELAFLRAHECDEAQGFYFSEPLPAWQFAALREAGLAAL